MDYLGHLLSQYLDLLLAPDGLGLPKAESACQSHTQDQEPPSFGMRGANRLTQEEAF